MSAIPTGAALEAQFEANYRSFAQALGVKPSLIVTYVDYTQTVASWPGNASWQAWSNAQSPIAHALLPVIGFPLYSIANGAPAPDLQFKMFVSGQYDSVISGVVQAWTQQGFKHLTVRIGWEMNIQGPTYAGSDAGNEADWVAAFRHVATVLRQAAAAEGATMRIVWNPSATNYTDARATNSLWPGDTYVDVVGVDIYSDIYPYSDGGAPPTYHDWKTGKEITSIPEFISVPFDRLHYWNWPAATEWSLDGSEGHSQSFASLAYFAWHHNKAFAVPETGAGNCNAGTDVCDDMTFPMWLYRWLSNARNNGLNIAFVDIWDSNGGGNYEFSYTSDNKPAEKAAWARYFGSGG